MHWNKFEYNFVVQLVLFSNGFTKVQAKGGAVGAAAAAGGAQGIHFCILNAFKN
jgi:hypothetical protein